MKNGWQAPVAISPFLRNEARDEDPGVVLRRPVTSLLGVSDAAAKALKAISIETIFDLASSSAFAAARQLVEAAELPESALARVGAAPHDIVDNGSGAALVGELELEPIGVLRQLNEPTAAELKAALDVSSIRELALWPPYSAARKILNAALGGTEDAGADGERPPDLVPATGRYPTERVQYDVLLLDKMLPIPDASPLSEALTGLEAAGQIDMTAQAVADLGFQRPAIGALLTFTQSWYTLGLSLGQLLHALALAPGESTRIAVIDWSRRSRAQSGETITEAEALLSDLGHNRSISEVTQAVAHESDGGWSHAKAAAAAISIGEAGGVAGGFQKGIASVAGMAGISLGASAGGSEAQSWSSSSGERDIRAEMSQYINDATHQASNTTRNRRATAIREVSQDEHEQLSTRAITNYNHMHALTIQYYEVVQLYRTVVELARITRCLFVPMKLVDFDRPGVIARYRAAIAEAALDGRVALLAVAEPDSFVISAPRRVGPWQPATFTTARAMFGEEIGTPDSRYLTLSLTERTPGLAGLNIEAGHPFESAIFESRDGTIREVPIPEALEGAIFMLDANKVFPGLEASKAAEALLGLTRISFRKSAANVGISGSFLVNLGLMLLAGHWADPNADLPACWVSVSIEVPAGSDPVVVLECAHTLGGQKLRNHLSLNQLHYSHAVWRTLDAGTLAVILSSYSVANRPLLEIVDPQPITVSGNYLVFRTYIEDGHWTDFLEAKKLRLGRVDETLVPLPSGGVFAEAVLGRSNAAEKLDLSRFWNWQDSPIPIAAPEIAALQSGSRAQPEDLKPGQLSAPVLNIVNAPALPDPQGLGGILAAIQNGNMFRDMSGLGATIGLAQSALGRAFEGAKDAAAQAGTNAAAAASLLSSLYGAGRGIAAPPGWSSAEGGRTSANPSEAGARLNYGRDLDRRTGTKPTDGVGSVVPGKGNGVGAEPSSPSFEADAWKSEVGTEQPGTGPVAGGGFESGVPLTDATQAASEELTWARQHPYGRVQPGWDSTRGGFEPDLIVLWNFGVGSADVSRFDFALQEFRPQMQRWIDLGDQLLIGGFASASGSEEQNDSLGLARALNVRDWLVTNAGFPEGELTVTSFGESLQLPPSEVVGSLFSGERAAHNRRVEIKHLTRAWDDNAYDHAAAVVAASTLPSDRKTRIAGVLKLLRDASSDDVAFNYLAQGPGGGSLYQQWGNPGFDWLADPSRWLDGQPPLLLHARSWVAASLHPGMNDAELLSRIVEIDTIILDGIDWVTAGVGTSLGGEGKHKFFELAARWIHDHQTSPQSIYQYY